MIEKGGVYFGKNAVFVIDNGGAGTARTSVAAKSSESFTEEYKKGKIARWGKNNNYPSDFLKQLRPNGAAIGGLRVLKSIHYGGGLVFHKPTTDDNNKRERNLIPLNQLPEVKAFFKANKMPQFLIEIISDLETFGMACPEYILSKNRKKIVCVNRLKTAWHRKELIDKKRGYPERIYYNSRWDHWGGEEDKNTANVHVVPTWWSIEEIRAYCEKKNIYKFCQPISLPMLDEGYYTKPDWHAAYLSGWFEVSNSIAKYKKALFENQLNLKYIVYIDHRYFEKEYGDDWHAMSSDNQKKIKDELMNGIDNHMTGNEAAGRSMYSATYSDEIGKPVDAIRIVPIDNKIKDGNYLPDASAANSEILFSLGVDPSLIGHGVPGGKLGAGSGSDKREAFAILQHIMKTKRIYTLQIWELLQEYNEWDPELEASFEDTILTTLDKNPNGQTNVVT